MSQLRLESQLDSAVALLVEELIDRLQAGEADAEAFVAAHPEHAETLRRLLPALRVMADLSNSAEDERRSFGSDGAPLGELGDFRLVREVGRGGMGVVYEAEQVSLGRRVALKVLPLAATLDGRQLQRFQNEARAAAGLHHTNIVPVYAVGCERGVHYYAMQFIDGYTLADLIARQQGVLAAQAPTTDEGQDKARVAAGSAPTTPKAAQATSAAPRDAAHFRRVAEWGIQAAEALDCAHALGVVHRDVKPANLILDGQGKLWVADFGLAQVQTDARLTMTGDLLGTLRYMSPEQALAKRVVIDHRTDIYSLGVTLDELMTGRPAVGGSTREEILKHILFAEPKPPRHFNRAIPRELETTILKAMEQQPERRYATANEFADDLRRYLRDEPIRARRPGLIAHTRRWARRHRGLVAMTTVALVVALAMLAGSIGWVMADRSARQRETERLVAEALQEAQQWQNKDRWPEALSAAKRSAGLLAAGESDDEVRELVTRRQVDLEMAIRLDDIRIPRQSLAHLGARNWSELDTAYGTAFRDYGIDVAILETGAAVERLRASTIRTQLLAALDDWSFARAKLGAGTEESLLDFARLVDDDPWRQRLRDPKVRRNRTALASLAKEKGVLDQPPADLVLLSHFRVRAAGRHPGAARG
jgi:serine/threonine protein kinase